MIKNLTGGAVINYGPTFPSASSVLDGTLFFKVGDVGGDEGLYIYSFNQDLTPGTPGDQVGQGWSLAGGGGGEGVFVQIIGDTMTGPLTVPDTFKISDASSDQRLLIGSTAGSGTNRPYIIQASGADNTLRIGFGNTWTGNGGTFTSVLALNTATNVMTIAGNTVWTSGNDGAGSGLDADLLDGSSGSFYLDLANSTGTLALAKLATGTAAISISGNAATATAATSATSATTAGSAATWTTARTISLTGAVTGSTSINGSANVSIATTFGAGGFVEIAGDTMTGPLIVSNTTNATTPTTGALRTTGGIGAALNIYAGGTIYANGDVISSAASDIRLKKNVQPITAALAKLERINGYTYDWDLDACVAAGYTPIRAHEHGVIAQEVAEVMPDAVVPTGFNAEYSTVKYERLVPLLIAALKEQQEQIDTLIEQLASK